MMQKLPIGIQTFSDIRQGNYIYIDKTKETYELIESYRYSFLSRPRRFGKSLFLDTLRNIFEGNKELFEGLYIYDKWDWSNTYPVITISWRGNLQTLEKINDVALRILQKNQDDLGVKCSNTRNLSMCLDELIEKTYKRYNQKVVILIDEYDKPILDNLEQLEVAKEVREYIKGLYSVIKGADEYVKFAFLTGVSKFSKASIFSGLNMLTDISLDEEYGNICGYTQYDIESSFKEYLDDVDLEELKSWYNGYNFLKDPVYNPFDILQFFSKKKIYDNYWFATGTPTFLIKLIEQNNYFLPKLSEVVVGKQILDSFDIENINLEVILYQSGYLTIDKVVEKKAGMLRVREYSLKIPNMEVKVSFYDMILDYITKNNTPSVKIELYMALASNDFNSIKSILQSLFASIPYNNYTGNNITHYEGFYATVVFSYLSSLGLEIIGEDVTNHGRIDITIKIENTIYIMEFKVNRNKEDALSQIKEKRYYEKYLSENKEIFLVGISFDKEARNINGFEWERVKSEK
jgi:Holliday junction resolvase-like predicted endonuclease